MMMMSSNTVGNHDFNTAGITPFDTKKPKAKKESPVKLATTKPDSFTKVHPRDVAEVDSTPVAAVQPSGNKAGLVGTILGATGLILGGVALWVGLSKGDAAELATKAAEAAKKEATELRARVETLGKGLTLEEIEEKIQQGVEDGINAIRTAGNKTLNDLEIDIDNVARQADRDTRELSAKVGVDINAIRGELLNQEAHNEQTGKVIGDLQLAVQNLQDHLHPKVAGKDVSKEVLALFKPTPHDKSFDTTPFAQAIKAYREDEKNTPASHSITVVKALFDQVNPALPGDLSRLAGQLPTDCQARDPYRAEYQDLKELILPNIFTLFKTGNKVERGISTFPQEIYDTIMTKAQAVVDAASQAEDSPANVKKAQAELVEALKNQFGKTKTERFKDEYPHAVMNFDDIPTVPWVKEYIDKNVLSKANSQERFEELSDMFLVKEGALDGNHKDSPHTNVKVLADDIVPNLAKALAEAYPEQLKRYGSGRINSARGVEWKDLPPWLGTLASTLNDFKNVLQPILPEEADFSRLLSVIAEDKIAKFTEAEKLSYAIIRARAEGKTDEIPSITEKMNNLLRNQLKALNEAKSAVIADTTPAISEGADKLVDKVFSSTHLQLPEFTSKYTISTSADALVAKMGENPGASMYKNSLIIVPLKTHFETAFPVPTESGAEKTLKEQQRDKAFHTLTSLLNAKKQKDKETDLTQLLPFFNFTKDHTIATITAFNQALDDLISPEEKLTHEVLMEKMKPVLEAIVAGVENSQPIEF